MKNKEIKGLTARETELKLKSIKRSYWKLYYSNVFSVTQPVEHVVKELQQLEEEV